MSDSPFEFSKLIEPTEGILTQEVITYIKSGDSVLKITVKRDFADNDYTDSMTTEVIASW